MNIGYFNARGPHNGIEHWFDLEIEELRRRGNDVRSFWLRGTQPTHGDVNWCDFIHFHFAQVANYYKRLGVPFAISPHANDVWVDSGRNLIQASNHPNCRFVTYQSYYHKKKFEEWGITKPLVYLPMSVRTKLFKRTSDIPNGEGIIAGGRLIPKKGLDRLKDVKNLTIFGDGPLKEQLKYIMPDTKFTGYLNGEELRYLMDRSWLYLFPCVVTPDGDSDGIPNTIKEAMLMRLQVIASPVAGIPELKNITLLDDWSKVNDVISNMKRQPNYKGEKEIKDIYSPEKCIDKFEKAVEEYL